MLCERVDIDQASKKLSLHGVFNRWWIDVPPEETGISPHASVKAVLAVGVSAGVGLFHGTAEIQDADGRALHRLERVKWELALGPGETMGATLIAQVDWWFKEPGNFFYVVKLEPGSQEIRVRLEVAHRPDQAPDPRTVK